MLLALADVNVSGRYFAAEREALPAPAAGDEKLLVRFYEESCRRVGIEGIARR
jgi:hypothetical protein